MLEMIKAEAALEASEGTLPDGRRLALRCGIVKNLTARYRGTCRREEAFQEDLARTWSPPPDEPTAEDLLGGEADRALFRAALDELQRSAPNFFAVLVAWELQERPMVEIAAELGLRLATAWNRLHLARRDLTAALRRGAARQEGGRMAA